MSSITSTLIAASAGTGKTYQLSLRFLSLLALGERPEKLIAVTFTRKAAGEFADRILGDLAKGASSEEAAKDLARRIMQTLEGTDAMPGLCPGLPPEFGISLTRQQFTLMLRTLVQNLARLNLSTIDSLFSRMVSTLTYELGLSSFRMIDTVTERREKKNTLLNLYRDCLESPQLGEALETIFLQGIKNDSEANDMDAAMEKIIASYHELFLDCPTQSQWGNPESLGIKPEECTPAMTPEQMADQAAILLHQAQAIDTSEMKTTAKRTLGYYTSFLSQVIDYPLVHYIEPKYEDISELKDKCSDYWDERTDRIAASWLAEETRRACERTKAAYGLVMAFESRYGKSVRDRGRFLFHDITRILHSNALPEHVRTRLEYRTDCAYKHWMLDEFQDTSRSQWHVLEPFLNEIAGDSSAARSIFVVGDVKQSIYQWRGGDPLLFRDLETKEPWTSRLRQVAMNLSFRSSQSVLDFANIVCNFKDTALLSRPEAIKRWESFSRHSSAKPELPGCAQVWQADSSDTSEEKKDEAVCRVIADILRDIQPTRRGKSCAILVPTNKYAVTLKNRLDACPDNFPVELCEDARVGTDSPLGKDLLLFFKWLATPGDALCQNFLFLSPLKHLTSLHGTPPESWSRWKGQLDSEGYSSCMQTISKHLDKTGLTEFQLKRLSLWMEEASEFDSAGGTLDEWIEHMEGLTRREDPPTDIIRIMTIHKSKGLEFDVVILPVSDNQKFTDKTHLSSFRKRDDKGNITGILLSPNKYVYQSHPPLKRMFEEWEASQQYEGFCKLYVALTRAVHATYVILPPGDLAKNSASAESFKTIFRHICGREESTTLPGSRAACLFSTGEPEWFMPFPLQRQAPRAELLPALPPPPSRLIRKTPSSSHASRTAGSSPQVDFGTSVHRTFERIHHLQESELPEWLSAPSTPAESLVAECLSSPDIRELFLKKDDSQIFREQPIEAVMNGEWISGTIDRLILSPGKAHIIDFKTDRVESAEELKTRHLPQLSAYRDIISQITGIPAADIQVTILSTSLKTVIPI